MKKLLVSVITTLTLLGSVFAVEFKVDADFALPIEIVNFSQSQTDEGTTLKSEMIFSSVPVGLSVGVDAYFTDLLGASLKANLGFTKTLNTKMKITGMDPVEGSMKFDSGIASSFFLGAAIRPVNGKFFFVATPGAILSFVSFKDNESDSKLNINAFGLGADLQAGYKITDKIAINGGVLATILFAPKMTVDGTKIFDDDVKKIGFMIEPKVGVSILF